MNIPVNPDPVAEAEAKHAGKDPRVIAMYMLTAAIAAAVGGVMLVVTPHLDKQNRWLEVQEVGQAAPYPLNLGSPKFAVTIGGLDVELARPTISPTGWYVTAARLKIVRNVGGSSYDTNGAWQAVSVPLADPVIASVPEADLPGGALVADGMYYVTLELTLTNDTDTKKFQLHSRHSWKNIVPP